jgi:hypothetical protein
MLRESIRSHPATGHRPLPLISRGLLGGLLRSMTHTGIVGIEAREPIPVSTFDCLFNSLHLLPRPIFLT